MHANGMVSLGEIEEKLEVTRKRGSGLDELTKWSFQLFAGLPSPGFGVIVFADLIT